VIVVDASALLEFLLMTEKGRSVEARIAPATETLHAPHLIDLEIAQVLRRFVARGILDDERSTQAVHDLRDLDLSRYPHDALLDRIWELRHNVSAYDAAYIALAEALGAPLLTSDGRLASVRATRVPVEVL
jgi:predicted nucleic acid-binding protein